MGRADKDLNYYRRYMADYGSKTASLSLAEHGAYNLLLDICYSTEKPLPAAYEALYRLCRAMSKAEQEAVKSVADQFFSIGKDGLRHNQRADDEIAKAQATIAKQRESGVESAKKRWSTDESTDGSTHNLTNGSAIQPPTSNLQPPNPKPQRKAEAAQRSRGSRLPTDWLPSEILQAWAAKERPDLNLPTTISKFRDFWAAAPGSKGVKLDWDATFRNWVRNERAGMTTGVVPDYSVLWKDQDAAH